jgi:hypothetical protein
MARIDTVIEKIAGENSAGAKFAANEKIKQQ